jgi:hypothetical protein
MFSDWTRGRPALIMVANWRVKMTMSRVFTRDPPTLSLICLGASRTLTRISRFLRR